MKIHWNENPLKSTVELDDSDRRLILHYIQSEMYSDILCDLDLWLNREIQKDGEPTLEKVHEKIRQWVEICNMDIDHQEVKLYEECLLYEHMGDCTCFPAGCAKCRSEEALGIDTIEGLSKHSAHKIMNAFENNGSIDQAIAILDQKPSYEKPDNWLGL